MTHPKMEVVCVGCGPGDPELITVKATNYLKNADIIFAPTAREGKPSIALSIVQKYLAASVEIVDLIFPMVKDRGRTEEYWKRNADQIVGAAKSGKRVVYLTVGDPSLYSTWIYIQREIASRNVGIRFNIVPGIPSIFAFAAHAKIGLAEGDETLGIIPACYDIDKIKRTASSCDTLVFLKDGRYFGNIVKMLGDAGFVDESVITIAQDISAGEEILKQHSLKELRCSGETTEKYFSLMVVKRQNG
ncbi:MAG: precorrin-2 C(20)-methyltransferase [Thermoproteota archaeon]|jgi:precorrin-2/cobalt-factor-2 C20-methyltransferase|nr:precorrin-2 C(20)-methyltransferase [Thermoproteota archaeon]